MLQTVQLYKPIQVSQHLISKGHRHTSFHFTQTELQWMNTQNIPSLKEQNLLN